MHPHLNMRLEFLHKCVFCISGKNLLCHPSSQPLNLKTMCQRLRTGAHAKQSKTNPWMNVPEAAFDLLSRLLDLNLQARTSADNALQHSFYTEAL